MPKENITSPVSAAAEQAEVVAFLSDRSGWADDDASDVERHVTHGAFVFLHGDVALKIKRAVAYAYMDFSTLERRRTALVRELDVNRANAPEIYVGLVQITRETDGTLRLGGDGEIVEWALRMRRFPQSALLSHQVRGGADVPLLKALADEIFRSHRDACVHACVSGADGLAAVIEQIARVLEGQEATASDAARLREAASKALAAAGPVLDARARAGFVRRCHGDLHLDNIVVIDGRPRLFDAIEFDEALATVDTLYDLAFALMDLEARASRAAANVVLNRYLWRSREPLDIDGLAALPLFLALRAGVRAMVAQQRAAAMDGNAGEENRRQASHYLEMALSFLRPVAPLLLAVGGFSGTGKSTLAAALAPLLGSGSGALHLRSDLERKALSGVEELERLPNAAYVPEESRRVYGSLMAKAVAALRAGQAVVVDAVFAAEEERLAVEAVARDASVPFTGLWLEAPTAELVARVSARTGDASDATPDVVVRQASHRTGTIGWTILEAGRPPNAVYEAAVAVLRRSAPESIKK